MNWLAHLFLSEDDPAYRIGNVVADWVKGEARRLLPPEVQRGIACHLEIDRFTDAHPVVRASLARFQSPFRRFAGVLVDVFYDHFLARDWIRYCDQPLARWKQQVYAQLTAPEVPLHPQLRANLMRMAREDWLGGYASLDGVRAILRRIAARMSRPVPLAEGVAVLCAHYEELRADFHAFFPELRAHVHNWQNHQRAAARHAEGEHATTQL